MLWVVVLQKILESPLDCKEIKPVDLKGNQPQIFIGRTDVEAEVLTLWPLMWRANSLEMTLMLRKIEGKRVGDNRGWDSWMALPTQWTLVWETLGDSAGQGSLACRSSRGQKELTRLSNWTALLTGSPPRSFFHDVVPWKEDVKCQSLYWALKQSQGAIRAGELPWED